MHTSQTTARNHLLEFLLCKLFVAIATLLENLNPKRCIADKLSIVVLRTLVLVLPLMAGLFAREVLLLILKPRLNNVGPVE